MTPSDETDPVTRAFGTDMTTEAALKKFAKEMSDLYLKGDRHEPKMVLDVESNLQQGINADERGWFLEKVDDVTCAHVDALTTIANFTPRQAQATELAMHSLAQGILGVIDGDGTEGDVGYELIPREVDDKHDRASLSGSLAVQYYDMIQS